MNKSRKKCNTIALWDTSIYDCTLEISQGLDGMVQGYS